VRRSFRLEDAGEDTAQAVARAAFLVARDIRAAAILTPTLRGNTPRLISKHRPLQIVLAATPSEQTQRKLLLYWGVAPLICELAGDTDAMLTNALQAALNLGYIKTHDRVVILAGVPVQSPVMLNMIRVHFLGTVLAKGRRGFGGYASGRVVKAADAEQARSRLRGDGTEILLTRFLTAEHSGFLPTLRGVIIEESSYLTEAEIIQTNPGIVVVSSVPNAWGQLEDGLTVTLHGAEFAVYEGVIRRA
jgi:pyruvate kinase